MLVEDYREPIAKEFALQILELLDLSVDPSNGWIVDLGTDSYIQINGRHLAESVLQVYRKYGFQSYSDKKKQPKDIYDIINNLDSVYEFIHDPNTKTVNEDTGIVERLVYQSSDMLFDPLNNVAIMNYLFTFIVGEIFGSDYIKEFCSVSVPGDKRTSMRVILNDGQVINSRPRYNDSVKVAEVLGLMISDDIRMPDYGAYDFEIVRKPSRRRR